MITYHACCFLPPPSGKRVILELTRKCNLRCMHCQVNAGAGSGNDMDANTITNALAELYGQGFTRVTFTGGEPLMRTDAYDIISLAKRTGYYVELLSNLTANVDIDFIDSYVDEVTTSIDGPSSDIHDQLRQSGAFDKTLTVCRQLVKRRFANWKVLSTVHRAHVDCAGKTVELLTQLRPRRIMFINPKSEGRGRDNDIALTDNEARRAAENIASADRGELNIGLSRFPWPGGRKLEQCIAADRLIYIQADGTIQPCQHWNITHPVTIDAVLSGLDVLCMQSFKDVAEQANCSGCSRVFDCGCGCRPFGLSPGKALPRCDTLCPYVRGE